MKNAKKNYSIIRLRPAFKDLIWGGTRLKSEFLLDTPYEHTAEALVLSAQKGEESLVSGGEFDGLALSELFASQRRLFGSSCEKYDRFPLLIKLIDTMDDVSVQVHPDDDYAMEVCGEWGKEQLWHVLDCSEGAYLICGLKEELNIDEFRSKIEDDTLISSVNIYEVSPGDTFYLEPGTLHAIGKDILLAEIGQNSELSYRVYDYCRVDENGESRPLNIQQSLDVTITAPPTVPAGAMGSREQRDGHYETLLAKCRYFSSALWETEGEAELALTPESFTSIVMTDGTLSLNGGETFIRKGESVIISAAEGILSLSGIGKFIATTAL